MGSDGARGDRRDRRGRRLGQPHVPDARGRQEQPVPPRGAARRGRRRHRSGHGRGRRSTGAQPVDHDDPRVTGRPRPLVRQPDRAIDWSADSTAIAIRRIHAAEGHPGVLDAVAGIPFHLFGAHREDTLRGAPGRSSLNAMGRSAGRRSTEPSGSATSSAPATSSSPPHARSPSRATSSTPPSCPRRCRFHRSPRGRSARSPTRSAAAWATWTSTSTTAR